MTQAFSLTADKITPVKGMYAYMPNKPQPHNAIFYSGTATDTLKAGDFVKLYASSTNTVAPVVAACATTDVPYGMVVYDCIRPAYNVGDKVALAQDGESVFLVAKGAISVGAKLQMVSGGYVDDTTEAGDAFIGIAETKASAQGDYVQVKLNFNLGVQASQG